MRHIYKIKTFPGLKTFEKQNELLDISLQSSTDKTEMRNDNKNYKSKAQSRCKLGEYCLKRILYWFGIGLGLLSACLVAEVYQASDVLLMRKEPLQVKQELSNLWNG